MGQRRHKEVIIYTTKPALSIINYNRHRSHTDPIFNSKNKQNILYVFILEALFRYDLKNYVLLTSLRNAILKMNLVTIKE